MAITRCPNGHYYDDSKFTQCPHCTSFGAAATPDATSGGRTSGASAFSVPDDEKTVSRFPAGAADDEKTERFGADEYEKTIGIMKGALKTNPVVGWLVCVEGPERGRDYRIHAGRNFIGRTWKMDINIVDDRSVSRENHASVVYEPYSGEFMIVNGESIKTYLNGVPVTEPMRLAEGDKIGIGDSVYDFIAYCKGERKWL